MDTSSKILLAHGSGGKLSHDLIEKTIIPALSNKILENLDDSAVFHIGNQKMAFTTDSYTIDPIFFPGGDIGRLAVCGTVNDLSMVGAQPLYISLGLIVEEGFPLEDFEKILDSVNKTALEAGVSVATGDTKIVPHNKMDKIFINTAGIGIVPDTIEISGNNARPGDKVILSGTMGDHGIAVLSKREGLEFELPLLSDAAPLNHLVSKLFEAEIKIHVLRDPTRGGVASSLIEIAKQSRAAIRLEEKYLPVQPCVMAACELLGLEPLYIANEGKFIAVIDHEDADKALKIMHNHPLGKNAAIIGEVKEEPSKKVLLSTNIGTTRIIDLLSGEQLPRIC